MKITVDSSVWIALILENDIHHFKTNKWFKENDVYNLYTPFFSLIEVAASLSRLGKSKKFIEEAIEIINSLCTEIIHIQQFAEICIDTAIKYKCRGADSVFLALSIYTDSKLLTLDKEQSIKFGKNAIMLE